MNYVLRGPSAGFPMASTDSDAQRGNADMSGLERGTLAELTQLTVYIQAEPAIICV